MVFSDFEENPRHPMGLQNGPISPKLIAANDYSESGFSYPFVRIAMRHIWDHLRAPTDVVKTARI